MATLSSFDTETIQTTVGDLVEALTSVALEANHTEEECYLLAALALEQILGRNARKGTVEWVN